MTVPMNYRLASTDFEALLKIIAERTGLATRNQAYTVLEGVLAAFRRRMEPEQVIAFAQILPAMPRAMLVTDWDWQDRAALDDRTIWTMEVKALRRDHNFAPDTAIADVSSALHDVVGSAEFDRCLSTLPSFAAAFWQTTEGDR